MESAPALNATIQECQTKTWQFLYQYLEKHSLHQRISGSAAESSAVLDYIPPGAHAMTQ